MRTLGGCCFKATAEAGAGAVSGGRLTCLPKNKEAGRCWRSVQSQVDTLENSNKE
jgi:hypothetical protein